jgi:hypothetical protein
MQIVLLFSLFVQCVIVAVVTGKTVLGMVLWESIYGRVVAVQTHQAVRVVVYAFLVLKSYG